MTCSSHPHFTRTAAEVFNSLCSFHILLDIQSIKSLTNPISFSAKMGLYNQIDQYDNQIYQYENKPIIVAKSWVNICLHYTIFFKIKISTYHFKEIEGSVVFFECSVDHPSIVVVQQEMFGIILATLVCGIKTYPLKFKACNEATSDIYIYLTITVKVPHITVDSNYGM